MRQSLLISGAILGMILPAAAEESQSASTAEVYACADIASDSERLACYDAAVGRLKSAEQAGDVVTVTRDEVEQVKKESFGFSIPSLPKFASSMFSGDDGDDKLDEMTVPVTRVSRAHSGDFIVYLENGSVWQQIDTKSVFYSEKRGVETATVKSAALGSYRMQLDDGVFFRVKRIQ
ncbi:hypothetical protein [Henriciella aquimarina]|uniref:hypothetical protein n=1 Tax=Henriciella aquimarina TaxID=545261 RepID=UPI00117AFAC3|nr:hypothetical protein [Henriciella aquimarina]